MAEVSLETQAIVDRLVAEGKLLRNTGTNSIKSVKEETLEKFTPILNNISLKMGETARALGSIESVMTGNLTRVTDQLETANEQAKEEREEEQAEQNETTRQNREREREGYLRNPLEGFKGIFGSIKDTLVDFRKKPAEGFIKFAKYAFLAPILAGAVKGALDLIFPGWLDSPFIQFIQDNPWTSFGVALVAFAAVDWVAIGASIISAMASLKAMAAVNRGGGTDVVGAPGGDDKDKGKKGKGGIRGFLKGRTGKTALIATGVGLVLFGSSFLAGDEEDVDDIEQELKDIKKDVTAEQQKVIDKQLREVHKTGTDVAGYATDAAIGAGIGFVFGGPFGALIGAASSVAFTAIGDIWNEVANSDEFEVSAATRTALQQEQTALNNRRKKLTEEQQVQLYKDTTAAIEADITKMVSENEQMDTDLASLEEIYAAGGVQVAQGSGRSKRKFMQFDVNGEKLSQRQLEERIQDMKNERVMREEQVRNQQRLVELRKQESEAVQENINTVEQATDTVAKKVNESLNGSTDTAAVEPETTERDRRQTVASGGFALNVVNNYYNKGGDTQISQQSDNRSAVTKNSAVAFGGGGGGGRFGGNLPNGSSMA